MHHISPYRTIPLAIVGAKDFYSTFVDLLSGFLSSLHTSCAVYLHILRIDIIGYWTASFAGIVLTEHVLFRRQRASRPCSPLTASHHDPHRPRRGTDDAPPQAELCATNVWDTRYPGVAASRAPGPGAGAGALPSSAPGLAAFVASCALVVPFMAQVWYTGPVARRGTGDLGLVVAFVCAVGLYAVLRGWDVWVERRRVRCLG